MVVGVEFGRRTSKLACKQGGIDQPLLIVGYGLGGNAPSLLHLYIASRSCFYLHVQECLNVKSIAIEQGAV